MNSVLDRLFVALILFASAIAFTGCKTLDTKAEEKRLLSEMRQVSEERERNFRSDEVKAHLLRLNELRTSFPEQRESITIEAQTVKDVFEREIEHEVKLRDIWRRLLGLPLSASYRNCVNAREEIAELMIMRSQKLVEEMNVLADPSVNDRETLDAKVETIRGNANELDEKMSEREAYLDRNNCRGPGSDEMPQ